MTKKTKSNAAKVTCNDRSFTLKTIARANLMTSCIAAIRSDATQQVKYHSHLVSVCLHWNAARGQAKIAFAQEFVPILNQFCALPYHGKAIKTWIAAFTPLKWSDITKEYYVDTTDCELTSAMFKMGRDNPFWAFKAPSVPVAYDLATKLSDLIDAAEKRRVSKKALENDHIPTVLMGLLKEALATYEATLTAEIEEAA